MAEHSEHTQHSHHIATPGSYLAIFAALIALTALTVFVAFIDLGIINTAVALAIAVTKAVLVILFFMHLKFSPNQTKLAMVAGIFWLMIMLIITAFDYVGRGWQPDPGGWQPF
ncbi:MAG: cytochrome C oxidase subunit IV family protein [candidate division Zixibacteria bacterium]|nr:cytochrome C oxidase subunit IV family protein [candidate division Zixibacteria bacterium]